MELSPSLLTVSLTLPYPNILPPSKKWKEIVSLSQNRSYRELIAFLTRQNLNEERERLNPSWIEKCAQLISEKKCLSFFCKNYPAHWKSSLGKYSPPSLWWNQISSPYSSSISIVGSRQIQPKVEKWTHQCAAFLSEEGFNIVSGGAIGVDRAAAIGSLHQNRVPIEILPFGIEANRFQYSACRFSICFPYSPFSTINAMIRNQLIYAYSPQTIVVQSNVKKGGTWYGAINALNKGLSKIYTWNQKENIGHIDLVKHGAIPFNSLNELISSIKSFENNIGIFSI